MFRAFQLQLRNRFAIASAYIRINMGCYMQDDIIIRLVRIMSMLVPIGRTSMYFNISYPLNTIQCDFGLEEIRPRIAISKSRINDFQPLARSSFQLFQWENLVFPYIMKQLFHIKKGVNVLQK